MSKFTKGQWRVKYNPIIQGIFDEDNNPVQLNEANARLIAAAPEMYELLEDVAWYLEQIADDDDESSKYASSIQELLARIDGEDEDE